MSRCHAKEDQAGAGLVEGRLQPGAAAAIAGDLDVVAGPVGLGHGVPGDVGVAAGSAGKERYQAASAVLRDFLVHLGTAANGAAAAAQIALTHREASSIVSFVAGQCKGLSEQDWTGLAGKGRTLVIYMGVKTAPQIAEKLIEDGLAPEMPVAVIENAARPEMRVLRGLLAGLPELVSRERVVSPALIVIGEVAARTPAVDGDLALARVALEASR